MPDYTPTIGLEIHAELKTRTKMFCNSANDPHDAEPNTNICPVCMAYPGTLPVINKEAVRHVLRVGAAVGGDLTDFSEFDRKNYFYPDIPKGYQISQYQYPLMKNGALIGIDITRVHLEEDTARSQHSDGNFSLIDFNRAGVPLMELVTEPVMHDAETAVSFAQELQLLLRTLGASGANMERGEMRVEANISVSKTDALGTKVEVKNLNSFRAVGKAIAYETKRHIELLERGENVIQETRGWDEDRGSTFPQRLKESSHDYRYFPDPDLPKIRLSRIAEFSLNSITKSLPLLPWEKRKKLINEGIDPTGVEVLLSDQTYSSIYEETIAPLSKIEERKIATNVLLTTVRGMNPSDSQLQNLGDTLATLASMRVSGAISSIAATTVIEEVLKTGRGFNEIANEKGLIQVHDVERLKKIVLEILTEHHEVAEKVRSGKVEALKYLVGQGMKKSKGSANPQELERLIQEALKA